MRNFYPGFIWLILRNDMKNMTNDTFLLNRSQNYSQKGHTRILHLFRLVYPVWIILSRDKNLIIPNKEKKS